MFSLIRRIKHKIKKIKIYFKNKKKRANKDKKQDVHVWIYDD